MHLYVVAKGIKPHLETWQNELLAQKIPMFKDGKPLKIDGKNMYTQIAVRPIQLFEIGFPKETLSYVMDNVGTSKYILNRYPYLNTFAKIVRKILKLQQVPLPKNPNPLMQPNQQGKAVAVIPVGIKEDMIGDDGIEQL